MELSPATRSMTKLQRVIFRPIKLKAVDNNPHFIGTCAVIVTGTGNNTHRSLCANLAAANCFTPEHLKVPENAKTIEQAKYYYISVRFSKSLLLIRDHNSCVFYFTGIFPDCQPTLHNGGCQARVGARQIVHHEPERPIYLPILQRSPNGSSPLR